MPYQILEEPPLGFDLRQVLRVPLDPDPKWSRGILDGLDDIRRIHGGDLKPLANVPDGLVVQAVDCTACGAKKAGKPTAGTNRNALARPGRSESGLFTVEGREILVERSASVHVEQLCPAADSQTR